MSPIFEFDFDEWAALARRDPEAFERRRDQVVKDVRARMRGSSDPSLFRVDWRKGIEHQCCTTFQLRRTARE